MDKQKTIKKKVKVFGFRQSDGKETYIEFSPYSGGVFVVYKGYVKKVDLSIINRSEEHFTTSIVIGGEIITMVEHIFSAVQGLGIDNLLIEFDSNEAPFSASSMIFAEKLEENILILDVDKKFIIIDQEIEIKGKDGQKCVIKPCDDFEVYITIDFDNIIGRQSFVYKYKETDYLNEVAYARSILIFPIEDGDNPWKHHKRHFDELPKILPNDPKECPFIAYNSEKFITPLKDPLEPVRHKLLDFIGDMLFLGKMPKGRFELYKPGHSFNRKIAETICNEFKTEIDDNGNFPFFLKKIPELLILKNIVENNIVHKNESVYNHTHKVLENTELLSNKFQIKGRKKFLLLLSSVLHDYGKKETLVNKDDNTTSCSGHEIVSEKLIRENMFLDRFGLSDEEKLWTLTFIGNHNKIHETLDKDDLFFETSIEKLRSEFPNMILEYLLFGIADIQNSYFENYNKNEYNRRIRLLENKLINEIG